jgi:hypothetical protein
VGVEDTFRMLLGIEHRSLEFIVLDGSITLP